MLVEMNEIALKKSALNECRRLNCEYKHGH